MKENSTRLYIASTAEFADKELYERAYQRMTTERKQKTDRFRLDRDRKLSVGAFLLLDYGLEKRGIEDWKRGLWYNENGKPYLADGQGIYFNLSHSGEYVACAVSGEEVGCDIEMISGQKMDIARRFFSPSEYELLLSEKTEQKKRELFFRLWTLKESFIKAVGKGLVMPLDSFSIVFHGDEILVEQTYDKNRYYFREFSAAEGYCCSLCGLDPEIGRKDKAVCEYVSFLELFSNRNR